MFNRKFFKSKESVDEQSNVQVDDEPLNDYIPVSVLFPYLLRDYRAKQKKVIELNDELKFERQKKNEARSEVKRLKKVEEETLGIVELELQHYRLKVDKLEAENRILRDTLIRFRNILTMGKVDDLLKRKENEQNTTPAT